MIPCQNRKIFFFKCSIGLLCRPTVMFRHPLTVTDQQYSDTMTFRDRITVGVMGLDSELRFCHKHKDILVWA